MLDFNCAALVCTVGEIALCQVAHPGFGKVGGGKTGSVGAKSLADKG